jgi:membrane-bound metal-dependent hydrolase YbcI (DUF457 family)
MLKPTHQALTMPVTIGVSLAAALPLTAAVPVIIIARSCAMLPDKMERALGVKEHRTWTHWLLTNIIVGVLLGLVVYGIGFGLSELSHARMCHHGKHNLCDKHAREFIKNVYQFGILSSFIVGTGITIACVMHSLADACTLSGAPLLGPFTKKDIHLMPEGMRTRTGEIKTTLLRGKPEPFQMTAGERRWLMSAYLITCSMIVFHFLPYIQNLGDKA